MTHDNISQRISQPHDLGYKSLLSHAPIFMDFLRSFLPVSWVEQVDVSSLMEASGDFAPPDFYAKHADLVFRLKLIGEERDFFIIIELQSTVDHSMPQRLLTYVYQLREQLAHKNPTVIYSKKVPLPRVFVFVLYNGKHQWTAANSLEEMTDYNELEPCMLNLHYILVDVNRCDRQELRNMSNSIGSIFLLDQKYDISELPERLVEAAPGIAKLDPATFSGVQAWLEMSLGIHLPDDCVHELIQQIRNLFPKGVKYMENGIIEAFDQRIAQAKTEGKVEGKVEGKIEGKVEGKGELLRNMINHLPMETICHSTGLSMEEVVMMCNQRSTDQTTSPHLV